jgi:hypothetical protein
MKIMNIMNEFSLNKEKLIQNAIKIVLLFKKIIYLIKTIPK